MCAQCSQGHIRSLRVEDAKKNNHVRLCSGSEAISLRSPPKDSQGSEGAHEP